MLYVALGDKDEAFAWLEKAYEERTPLLRGIKRGYAWDSLRSDPRFKDLLKRMGLPEALKNVPQTAESSASSWLDLARLRNRAAS